MRVAWKILVAAACAAALLAVWPRSTQSQGVQNPSRLSAPKLCVPGAGCWGNTAGNLRADTAIDGWSLTAYGGGVYALGSGGLVVGSGGSTIAKSVRCTATLATAAIAANTTATQDVACAGAAAGAECVVGGAASLNAGLVQVCYVSAADTITLRTHNGTAGSITPTASLTTSVRVFNP